MGWEGTGADDDKRDPVVDSLQALVTAIEENTRVNVEIRRRVADFLGQRAEGRAYREILSGEEAPLIVEMLRANLERLFDAGSRVRREQAKALHDEGLTMEQIARLFGVTRQRVSALLRSRG